LVENTEAKGNSCLWHNKLAWTKAVHE
jgi:hypothetical protein